MEGICLSVIQGSASCCTPISMVFHGQQYFYKTAIITDKWLLSPGCGQFYHIVIKQYESKYEIYQCVRSTQTTGMIPAH